MKLFSPHINCSTTNTIQNIFILLRAIKVRVISNISSFKFQAMDHFFSNQLGLARNIFKRYSISTEKEK